MDFTYNGISPGRDFYKDENMNPLENAIRVIKERHGNTKGTRGEAQLYTEIMTTLHELAMEERKKATGVDKVLAATERLNEAIKKSCIDGCWNDFHASGCPNKV